MKGLASFVRKEVVEILRTWRIAVLPGMVLFFALTGPVLAMYMPEIMKSLGGSTGGIKFIIPEPTYLDAYGQWIKNISQTLIFAIIIIYGGLVSSERKSGTAILVLTKPVSREAFVIAKFLTQAAFLAILLTIGGLLTWGMTAIVFPEAPFAQIAAATGTWLVYGVLLVALMTLLSVVVNSPAGAAGLGFGVYVLTGLLTMWKAAALYSPIGLMNIPVEQAAGKHPAALWPVVTALVLAVVFVAAAAMVFKRQEL